jgi:cytochrome c553
VQNFIQIQAPFSFKSFLLLSVSLALFVIGANSVQAQEIKGSIDAGKGKVWLCTGCHSIPDYRADWPVVYRVPKIGGQSSAYIVSSLTAYKTGERKHPTMRAIAGSLSDQDMADIAEYYATQNASSVSNTLK